MTGNKLIEVPAERPENLITKDPKQAPFYLKNQKLDKEWEGKSHFVKFMKERIQLDNSYVDFPTSWEGFKKLMKDLNPGYHQSFHGEEKRLYEPLLSKSQASDMEEVGECTLGNGDKLLRIGQGILYKEKRGMVWRNYALYNVVHLNNFEEVPDELVVKSPLYLSVKLGHCGLILPNMASQGSIARGNILEDAYDGYFPLWLLDSQILTPFYDSIKGPSFRNFTIGDSPDTISSDLVLCYAYILMSTPSPAPFYCTYIKDINYHPEATFAACKIWISVDQLEVTPIGVRIAQILWPEDESILPITKNFTVYPWGDIREVNVNLPMLWFLLERLKLRLGKDLGIIEGTWAIPNGAPVFAWRDWARKILKALSLFPELKFLYQMGPTGGKFQKATKVGEFKYEYEWVAFANENPIVLSHLFDMTRTLVLLGAHQCKKIKGIAADGWVSEGGVPDKIGPVQIGGVTYGPFPVKNTALENYYQFDQIRHDEIISRETHKGEFWRPLAEEFADKPEIEYKVEMTDGYGHTISHTFSYKPSSGDNIPDRIPEVCGDTLNEEISTKPPHTSQVTQRIPYIREHQIGRSKYG